MIAVCFILAMLSGCARPVSDLSLSPQALEARLNKAHVQAQVVGETVTLVSGASTLFLGCSANPTQKLQKMAPDIASYVGLYSPEQVGVAVFADPKQSPKYPRVSQALMQKRSEAIVQSLIKHGLHAPIVVASGDPRYLKAKKFLPLNPLSYQGLVVITFKKHPSHWGQSQ